MSRRTHTTWPQAALGSVILRGVVGSTAHGLALAGQDDRDEMAVCLPPPEWVLGLTAPTHLVQRDAAKGERSRPGDLDLTVYSLRRYVELLLRKANPTCQILLWLPPESVLHCEPLGRQLRSFRRGLISQRLGRAFLGYMRSQRGRLTGERGQKRCNRPELIAAYGYDTKYAGHVIRLGLQGIEMAEHRRLTLPMPERQRDEVLAVRRGFVQLADVVARADGLASRLERLIPEMPPKPDPAIGRWMVRAHLDRWEANRQGFGGVKAR